MGRIAENGSSSCCVLCHEAARHSEISHANRDQNLMGPREWALLVDPLGSLGRVVFLIGVAVQESAAAHDRRPSGRSGGARPPRGPALDGAEDAERCPRLAAFFGMGLLNNAIPFTLIVWGQSHIASGLASILNSATTPAVHGLVAPRPDSDERMLRSSAGRRADGFAGVAAMIGGGALHCSGSTWRRRSRCWAQRFPMRSRACSAVASRCSASLRW